jgi:hypothetical protein
MDLATLNSQHANIDNPCPRVAMAARAIALRNGDISEAHSDLLGRV